MDGHGGWMRRMAGIAAFAVLWAAVLWSAAALGERSGRGAAGRQREDVLAVTAREFGREDPDSAIEIESESIVPPEAERPTVVIYHTHTHEAYTPAEGESYVPTGEERTADTRYSIVAVGAALADELRQLGFTVIHDTTDHEPPRLGTAYVRSLETAEALERETEGETLFLDLHRDAWNASIDPAAVAIEGTDTARLLFVIGTGEGSEGNTFSVRPDYEKNHALADALCRQLDAVHPDLVRGISVKTGRYNQHIGTRNILVEMGHNHNTLAEALAAVPHLARAICETMDQGGA